MDGENNGNPYEQMDDLGGFSHYFWFNTQIGKRETSKKKTIGSEQWTASSMSRTQPSTTIPLGKEARTSTEKARPVQEVPTIPSVKRFGLLHDSHILRDPKVIHIP